MFLPQEILRDAPEQEFRPVGDRRPKIFQPHFLAQGGADRLMANRSWTYWKSLSLIGNSLGPLGVGLESGAESALFRRGS